MEGENTNPENKNPPIENATAAIKVEPPKLIEKVIDIKNLDTEKKHEFKFTVQKDEAFDEFDEPTPPAPETVKRVIDIAKPIGQRTAEDFRPQVKIIILILDMILSNVAKWWAKDITAVPYMADATQKQMMENALVEVFVIHQSKMNPVVLAILALVACYGFTFAASNTRRNQKIAQQNSLNNLRKGNEPPGGGTPPAAVQVPVVPVAPVVTPAAQTTTAETTAKVLTKEEAIKLYTEEWVMHKEQEFHPDGRPKWGFYKSGKKYPLKFNPDGTTKRGIGNPGWINR